jgi:hypothetical protein
MCVEGFQLLLRAANSFFRVLFTISPSQYIFLPIKIWFHLGHSLMTLYRLSIIDHQDWDREQATSDADVVGIARAVIGRFRRVADEAGLIADDADGGLDIFHKAAAGIERMLEEIWEPEIRGRAGAGADASREVGFDVDGASAFPRQAFDQLTSLWMESMLMGLTW